MMRMKTNEDLKGRGFKPRRPELDKETRASAPEIVGLNE